MPDAGWRTCPECDGAGYEEVMRYGVNGHGPWVTYSTQDCVECDGLGEIPDD